METPKLPALPTNADPAAFIAECEAALTVLIPMESSLSNDLNNEEGYRREKGSYYPKAVAHLTEELKAVRAWKKEIGVAKRDATIANAEKFAESFDREADALGRALSDGFGCGRSGSARPAGRRTGTTPFRRSGETRWPPPWLVNSGFVRGPVADRYQIMPDCVR